MGSDASSRAFRLSPPGRSALQVFGLRGPAVPGFLERCLQVSGGEPPGPGSLRYGVLVDRGEAIDEVLVLVRAAQSCEVTTHGGRAVERRVLDLLSKSGFDVAGPKEALRAWEIHDSAIACEAFEALADAWADHAILFLLAATEGSLALEIESIARRLTVPSARDGRGLGILEDRLRTLMARSRYGCAMVQAPRVVISGPTNAGKSTLFNRLLQRDRAIVDAAPGTTRDVIEVRAVIEGFPFFLVDTAGVRAADSDVEREGIERGRRAAEGADVVVELGTADEAPRARATAPGASTIRVVSKSDLLSPDAAARLKREAPECLLCSGRTGEGVADLERRIVFASPFGDPVVRDLATPFTRRQIAALEAAIAMLPERPHDAARVLLGMIALRLDAPGGTELMRSPVS